MADRWRVTLTFDLDAANEDEAYERGDALVETMPDDDWHAEYVGCEPVSPLAEGGDDGR